VDGTVRATQLALRYISAPLAVAAVLVASLTTGREALFPILIVLCVNTLLVPISATATLPFEFHQTQHRRIVLPLIASVVRISTAFLAVRLLATPVGFQLSGLSAGIAMLVMNVFLAQRYYPAKFRFDRGLAMKLVKLALPAATLEFIAMMYMRGAYLTLHGYGEDIIGEYAAADRMVKPIIGVVSVFLSSSLPTIASLVAAKKFELLIGTYRKAITRMLLVMVPLLVAVWFLAPWILDRFAKEWTGAVWPLRILSISLLFVFLNSMSSVFIISLGELRLIIVVALVNLIVFFGLAHVLVPKLGAAGAALATASMEGVNSIMQLSLVGWLLRRAHRRSESGDHRPV
jgi:O-antigen/teichoic acid export membrane protein